MMNDERTLSTRYFIIDRRFGKRLRFLKCENTAVAGRFCITVPGEERKENSKKIKERERKRERIHPEE